ncbi:hypothetical protein [Haloflavibacter putidus]|uniref:Tetratricopeptide repeat protein n=1 Tax=Haloflavibacter putidus TaxID=2576776 RepID=A0A507ZY20_9FLAO|nr:hypothetical protein [Haloflavibacter putidus]TQD39665.1 hypothetical protein FKR84_03980 [Haloflavibacter putidus]
MNKEAFLSILSQNSSLDAEQTNELDTLVEAYPYFQAARAMQLKGIKMHRSFSYNQALKVTAAHTTDRAVLFDFITSKEFTQQSIAKQITNNHFSEKAQENEIAMNAQEANKILDPNLFSPAIKEETNKENRKEDKNSAIGAPLEFDKKEEHSFAQWLQLTKVKPLAEEKEAISPKNSDKKKDENFDLIDNFIANNPKIKPSKEKTFPPVSLEKNQPSQELMTETLARVYLEQKNYEKAIQAYNILILKNPEKSSLFADQIRAIKKLQEK